MEREALGKKAEAVHEGEKVPGAENVSDAVKERGSDKPPVGGPEKTPEP